MNETGAPVLKSMLLEPIPALGFLLGPCDYSASARPCLCPCVCVSENVLQQVWRVSAVTYMTCSELKSKTEQGI